MIYLVMGQSDDWEDRAQWAVRAFTTQADADAYCAQLTAWWAAWRVEHPRMGPHRSNADCPLDPQPSLIGYDIPLYNVVAVPIDDEGRG